MKIRTKLLINFGVLLAVMFVVFGASTISMYRERSAKTALANALSLSQAMEGIRHQMMENRLSLSNYLLTGAGTELDRLHDGTLRTEELLRDARSKTTDSNQIAGLNRIDSMEREWYTTFADRFIQAHRDVDSGKMTANDLLEQYTRTDPMEQLKRSNEVINEVQSAARTEPSVG
jgi:CHASE3 domain sensor protein